MLGNYIKSLTFILILAFCFSCKAGENDINKTKESIMAFEINNIAYPIRFANYQRNSIVPIEMKSKWKPLWLKPYAEINEDITVLPYTLLIKDDY